MAYPGTYCQLYEIAETALEEKQLPVLGQINYGLVLELKKYADDNQLTAPHFLNILILSM